MNKDIVDWTYAKSALENFEDILRCFKCSKVAKDPVNYTCGHFFCRHCVNFSETSCQACRLPSKSSEITPDRFINAMVASFLKLATVILPERHDLLERAVVHSNDKEVVSSESTTTSKVKSKDPAVVKRKSNQSVTNDENVSELMNTSDLDNIGVNKAQSVRKYPAKRAKRETPQTEIQSKNSLDIIGVNKAQSVRKYPAKRAKRETPQTKIQSRNSFQDCSAVSNISAKPLRARRSALKEPTEKGLEIDLSGASLTKAVPENLKEIASSDNVIKVKATRKSAPEKMSVNTINSMLLGNRKSTRTRSQTEADPKLKKDLKSDNSINVEDCSSFSINHIPKRSRKSSDSSINHSMSSVSSKGRQYSNTIPKVSSTKKPSMSSKVLEKPNQKGETPLHVACIKGNVDLVRSLLSSKANPNTKDYAGWTPLHEVAYFGNIEIVRLLLEARAMVNVPGENNLTPLHEAVKGRQVPVVRLLVSHGADVNALSSDGKTPLDLADTEELREVLKTTVVAIPPPNLNINGADQLSEDMVLCGASGLEDKDKAKLNALAIKLNVKVADSYNGEVTHLVAPSDNSATCPPSMDVLSALLQGIWILTRDWLEINDGPNINDIFELSGVTDFQDACAPKRSRINAQNQLPGLLNGCHFYLTNNASYKMEGFSLSKTQLTTLIKLGGGVVLSRQPNPESIPVSEQTIPYHASRNGALAATSHYIIFGPGKGEPQLKYNMKHFKSLTVEWLINCILNWKLIDP